MPNESGKVTRARRKTRTPSPGFRSSLRTRLRVCAFVGIAILGAWLAYTVNSVLTLYDVTLTIQRTDDLRERVGEAQTGLSDAEEALDRYTASGQGYDLSRHNAGRTALHMALGAISRRVLTESSRGLIDRAEAAEEIYAEGGRRSDRRLSSGRARRRPRPARQRRRPRGRKAARRPRGAPGTLPADRGPGR